MSSEYLMELQNLMFTCVRLQGEVARLEEKLRRKEKDEEIECIKHEPVTSKDLMKMEGFLLEKICNLEHKVSKKCGRYLVLLLLAVASTSFFFFH